MLEYKRTETADGAAFLIGTDNPDVTTRLKQAARGGTADTPTPSAGDGSDDRDGGPIERFTNEFSSLGMGILEQLGLNGHEIANDIQTRVSELYRNEFPVLKQRFERKCADCGAEYAERVDACQDCGGDVREPDPAEKRRAEELIESVNKEGQSLRELAELLEWDQWLTGVPVLVLRHEYTISPTGEVVKRAVDELRKGDPKRIVPVVDENRRIGGYWWACPRCRQRDDYEPVEQEDYHDRDGRCQGCGTHLREVYFAEYGESRKADEMASFYFEEEILTFPWPFPRLNGLDGLSPICHVWLKQLIIDMQDRYASAFYDPESDRLPNQFMILHTTNPDAWDELLDQAREDAKDDEYDSPVYSMEYTPEANEKPEVQVIDAMPDELLGQNQELRDTYKKDIRRATNISDVHDNDTSDAGGLNNEGLQIEVTDRPTATQMHDYMTGWLDTLAKRLGLEDWQFAFIPSTGPDAEDLRAEVEAGLQAEQGGLDARMVDGQVEVADGPFDPVDPAPRNEGPPGDGGQLPMGQAGAGGDYSSHDYGPTLSRARSEDLSEATDVLFKAHQHMVFPDEVEQRAREPFWDRDESMPEFVQDLVRESLRSGAIRRISESLPAGTARSDVRRFFEEQLTQPQGWSLRSLTENYANRFGVSEEDAVNAVRTQTANVLNEAREEGYRRQGDTDERRFKWIGPGNPDDGRTTDACIELKRATNPDHGGDPVTLDELRDLVARANREHFPDYTGDSWTPHWACRHTYVEHFD